MTELYVLLAQATTATRPAPPSGAEFFLKNLFPIVLIIGVFWWIMSRGRTKEKRRYEQMLNSLKRNDRVITIGGVIGTVVDTREDEVVLKVDEASNVKMRFSRTAIKGLTGDVPASDGKS